MKNLLTILFLMIVMQGCNEPEAKTKPQSFIVCSHPVHDSVNLNAFWVSPLITEKELKDRYGITIQSLIKRK